MQYWTCPLCGANLDNGEKCDCSEVRTKKQDFFAKHLRVEPGAGQLAFVFEGRDDRENESYC